MEKPILVVLAAGMGSRYGGLKQIDPVGPNGEVIIDYSLYDAKRAGFEKVVFIIKREIEADFKEVIGSRVAGELEVAYAYQELGMLPGGYALPEGRVKPWGTTHAVLAAKEHIHGPFAVINADDYYGPEAYKVLYEFLSAQKPGGAQKAHFAMVGYLIENTVTDKGTVARGVCEADAGGYLSGIVERLKIAKSEGGAQYTEDDGASWTSLPQGTLVSMNFWGFGEGFLRLAEAGFPRFLDENLPVNPLKCEYLLPSCVDDMIHTGAADVKVLSSDDVWYGVTYREDKPGVVAALAEKHKAGQYPTPLWPELKATDETPAEKAEDLHEQAAVRREKLRELQAAGKDPFLITSWPQDAYADEVKAAFADDAPPRTVCMAGRVMSKRVMGKASFIDLMDNSGNIQVYVRRDAVGDDAYADFKKFDIGDIAGVRGEIFRTKMGEITVKATEVVLLSKSLLPLPEKWHGLKDVELRYRQRYVDLIVNPEVKKTFRTRSRVISAMRRYFDAKGFLEVETPMLQTQAGGANARPFSTHHNALGIPMHLRISLELYLKRLIVGGFDRVYEIGRNFRNEGMDATHNPEFTMIELYQAYTDMYGMMDLWEDMMRTVAREVLGGPAIVQWRGETIDLEKPFARKTMLELVREATGIDWNDVPDTAAAKKLAAEHHIEVEERHAKGDVLSLFYEEYCEAKLQQPTFVTGYPVEISPLAKKDPENPGYTLRFELFIMGDEFANAFSELNDPIDQRARFEYQEYLKKQGDEEASGIDEDFINALSYGMPPTGGLGMGIDRFVMLLSGETTIRDVLLFPTMKPLAGEGGAE